MSLPNTPEPPKCQKCGVQCVAKVAGPNSKNPGREFWACPSKCEGWNGFIVPDPPKSPKGFTTAAKLGKTDEVSTMMGMLAEVLKVVKNIEGRLSELESGLKSEMLKDENEPVSKKRVFKS